MNRVVHFEIPAENPEQSIHFYQNVFGWKFNRFGEESYWLAETGPTDKPGINGAVMKRRDPAQPIVNSIEVASMDEAIEKVKKFGGLMVVPKTTMPGVGWLAYFKDPEGYIFGLWQNDSRAK